MGITKKVVYVASDGKEFHDERLAQKYEDKIASEGVRRLNDYYKSEHYRTLSREYDLTTHGLWDAYGPDTNYDLGGPHHEPHLGTFEGVLEDVIKEVASKSAFWDYGPGRIKAREKIIKVGKK